MFYETCLTFAECLIADRLIPIGLGFAKVVGQVYLIFLLLEHLLVALTASLDLLDFIF